jgi:hypothetical protein
MSSWTHWLRSPRTSSGARRGSDGPGRPRSQQRRFRRQRLPLGLESLEARNLFSAKALSLAAVTMLSDTATGNVQGPASVSGDGRYVVYSNTAANLSPNEAMAAKSSINVFLYDRATGITTLVSHAAGSTSTTADGKSLNPVISADGHWVAFVSNSDNLVTGVQLANDTYTLTIGNHSGGTFTLTYGTQTISSIAWNVSASTLQSDLAALSSVGSGNVTVTGSSGVFTITFTGTLGHGNASALTANGSGLTGGSGLGTPFSLLGDHNEFLCDQYWVFLYNVSTGQTTLVSHIAGDQTTLSEGTSGMLNGNQGSSLLGGTTGGSEASTVTSVSISKDGSYLTYLSTGTHLVSGETDVNSSLGFTAGNVFVYQRGSDTNILVSRQYGSPTNSAGLPTTPGDQTSYVAVIDQNGDTIVFGSQDADIVQGQTINSNYGDIQGETEQWFVAKIGSNGWSNETTQLASHDLTGVKYESVTNSTDLLDYPAPVITPDGHYVAFVSDNAITESPISGTNAGKGDNIYLYDTTNPNSVSNVMLVSHVPGDTSQVGNGQNNLTQIMSASPAISDDGRYVAFATDATNLTSSATSAGFNVFIFDRLGTVDATHDNVTRITKTSIPKADLTSTTFSQLTPSISGDGRYVAYAGFSSDAGVSNSNTKVLDALLYDQGSTTPSYTLLSHSYGGTSPGTGSALTPVVDDNGDAVFFLDNADNLIQTVGGQPGKDLNAAMPGDGTDLFAYSLKTPSGYTPLAANGTNATVTLRDPNLPSLTANGLSEVSPIHAISDDGRFTVFFSTAPNLVAGEVDTNLTLNVYLYDNQAQTVTLLSHMAGLTSQAAVTAGDGESTNAVISGDGTTVLFYSYATDLISGETFSGTSGKDPELYLYNVQTGTLSLVSHTPGNDLQAANMTLPGSPNGLSGTSTLLYSNATTAQGLALPSVSSNGQYIAYLSNATNLSGSTTGTGTNVFLYDRSADTNTMVSHASGATTTANKNADSVAISGDGSTIAFTDNATNLLSTSITTSFDQLYVWSRTNDSATGLSAGQIELASHTSSSNTTAASFSGSGLSSTGSSLWGPLPPSLSTNGEFVAYYFGGNNLVANQAGTAAAENVFRYDANVNKNTSILVSHASGADATAGNNPTNSNQYEASGPAISSDGRYIAYANNSTNLLSTTLTGQNGRDNVYLYDATNDTTTLVSHADGQASTPDAQGGTSPSISSTGEFVSFIDVALDNTADVNCTFVSNAYVRKFDSSSPSTTQQIGGVFNPTPMLLVGATLAPTDMSADGTTITWDGLASDVVTGDRNGNLDVFLSAPSGSNLVVKAQPITSPEGAQTTFTVATLQDTNLTDTGSSFVITIDWGDGSSSSGTATGGNGNFTITGTHTYADEKTTPPYTFKVTVTRGTLTISDTNTATVTEADTLAGSLVTFSTPEGVAYTGSVATFTTTYTGNVASDFTATIDWGDGVITNGTITGSNGSFTVNGGSGHAYADEGTYGIKVTIKDADDGTASLTLNSTNNVTATENDTLAAGTPLTLTPIEGTTFTGTVATFTSSYTGNVAADFSATITWGDGTTTAGTITGSNGKFTVSATGANGHSYPDEGTYGITVTVKDDAPGTATITLTATANVGEGDTLSGTGVTLTPTEGTAFTGTVATFTTTYLANTAADFTATINWGDGTTTTGTITGSNGQFTVSAVGANGHLYADEGSYGISVTIKDDAPGTATLTVNSTANVQEADQLTVTVKSINVPEGTSLSNVQVATFTTTYLANTASDFTATIDWGDGTTSQGTITGSNGNFVVTAAATGGHNFDEGSFTIKVTVSDDAPGTATATGQANATITESDTLTAGTPLSLTPTEGTGFTGTVATFTSSYTGNPASDFIATIDWGDGTTSAGVVTGSNGNYSVSAGTGGHVYADEGTYGIKVTIKDDDPGTATLTLTATANVQEGDTLTASSAIGSLVEGTTYTGALATFTSSYKGNVASDFTATIDWGDGTVTTGTITGSNGSYTVSATGANGHSYADEGTATIKVTISDDAPGTATVTATINAPIGEGDTLSATGVSLTPTEGTTGTGTVATFTTTYLANTASDFIASINWGDGTTTTGTITGSNGQFTVSATGANGHTYADEGSYGIKVTISDDTPGTATVTANSTAVVAEADQLTVTVASLNVPEGTPLSNLQVATFTTTYLANTASDFVATIDWGDGTTSQGTVTGGNGKFTVTGSGAGGHNLDEGTFTLKVTVADDAPGTATATGQASLTITEGDTLSASPAAAKPVEGVAYTGPVATFTTTYLGNVAGDFVASIDWGDGTVTSGTVTGSNGSFTVNGGSGHAYADEGTYPIKVTISDDAPGTATASVSYAVTVAEGDNLSVSVAALKPVEGVVYTGPVATFTSSYTGNPASDFTAAINWGDGTTTVGTITGGNGSFGVSALGANGHLYADEGTYGITVTISDDAPGTAVGLGSGAAAVQENDQLAGSPVALAPVEGTTVNGPVATFTTTYLANVAADFTATINWGDGTTTNGTITGGNGSFTVSAVGANGHSWADEGSYGMTVTIKDDAPGTAQLTVTNAVTVGEADVLAATAVPLKLSKGQTFAGTVATFTSTYLANTASDFSATIDWGDGTTTSGTITGGNGNFTVTAVGNNGHAYAAEGTFGLMVTIKDDAPGTAVAKASAVVTVGTGTGLNVTVSPLSAPENLPLTSTQLATYTTTNLTRTAADFTASINWGDGTTTTGGITGSNGNFTVSAGTPGHTYADEGAYPLTITVTDTPGNTSATGQAVVTVTENDQLIATGTPLVGSEGKALAEVQVATFTSSFQGNVAADFSASIDWGDGATTVGTITGANGVFVVRTGAAGHAYADEGPYTVTVTISDDAPGTASAKATSTATIGESDVLTGSAAQSTFSMVEGTPFTGPLAFFASGYAGSSAADFTATINWGDGNVTAGTVSVINGVFTVSATTAGSHAYADEGAYAIAVTIKDDDAGTASVVINGVAAVTEADQLSAAPIQPKLVAGLGGSVSGAIANFVDTYTGNVAGDFSAAINWGDGTITSGTVSGGNGAFTVSGSHTYSGSQNSYNLTVTLTEDNPGTATATAANVFVVAVTEEQITAAANQPTPTTVEGTPFSGLLAVFNDSNSGRTASSFTASIDWGDGTTTSGVVSGSSGVFNVTGSHSYASDENTYLVHVTLSTTDGSASGTVTNTLDVTEADKLTAAGTQPSVSVAEGDTFKGPVAIFNDSFTGGPDNDFTVTIEWGDGTKSTGTVTRSGGTLTVSGSHQYADEGAYMVTTTITDDDLGTATATATTVANVSDVDQPSGTAPTINATAGSPFSGSVAFFTDTNTNNTADDFLATIDWGDGTVTSGTVSGKGGNFTVSGSHTYATSGTNTVTVTLQDDPGNAKATAVGSAIVADNNTGNGANGAATGGGDANGAIATGGGHDGNAVTTTTGSQGGTGGSSHTPAVPAAATPPITLPVPPTTPATSVPLPVVGGPADSTTVRATDPASYQAAGTTGSTTSPNATTTSTLTGSGTAAAAGKGANSGVPAGTGKGDPGSATPKSDAKGAPSDTSGTGTTPDKGTGMTDGFLSLLPGVDPTAAQVALLEAWSVPVAETTVEDELFAATDFLGEDFGPVGSEGAAFAKAAGALLSVGLWTKFARDEESRKRSTRTTAPAAE